jgi:hypothetical protein
MYLIPSRSGLEQGALRIRSVRNVQYSTVETFRQACSHEPASRQCNRIVEQREESPCLTKTSIVRFHKGGLQEGCITVSGFRMSNPNRNCNAKLLTQSA